uniref:Uncharacterized protein LOC114348469 n=1 Tax=Diabrotica virgifera virgifera TaxID=50390 RepID=A0A6P7HGP3_DIAVI
MVVNAKGRNIIDFMNTNSFCLLNGRTESDTPAQFTHISKAGNSVIDLAFIQNSAIPIIQDLCVMNHNSPSDHFGILVTCVSDFFRESRFKKALPIQKKTIYQWNTDLAFFYKISMQHSNKTSLSINIDAQELYNNLMSAIKETASQLQLCKEKSFPSCIRQSPPWFDHECTSAKNNMKQSLKTGKYFPSCIRQSPPWRDSKTFWSVIKKFRKNHNTSFIDVDVWEQFYSNIYPPKLYHNARFFDARHPIFDAIITSDEIYRVLNNCPNRKAPGTDHISYEFFKNLPNNWILYLTGMFNRILETTITPHNWSEVIFTMIFKKGNRDDPANYRGIALLNCVEKIFTNILLNRLRDWLEVNNVLPECQSGFRGSRGCNDNVFTLTSAVQLQLRLKKRKVYAAFVDYKRAFDSIIHHLLWQKLFGLGVSSKIIAILKNIYDNARMYIKTPNGYTRPFDISTGVLQGELLSPLLFSLFIADIEQFFISQGSQGISIDSQNKIIMLLYADDLVILCDSEVELGKNLSYLEKYSDKNQLTVNVGKTKILPFARSGQIGNKGVKFLYKLNKGV